MQGPITVFDGGVYAGDAKIEDLPPGSERLISYAHGPRHRSRPGEQGPARGTAERQARQGHDASPRASTCGRTEYTVKNSGKKPKKVLIEYPFDADWKLVAPKEPAEKTRNLYRFAVEAKPGEPAKLHGRRGADRHAAGRPDEPRRQRDPVLPEHAKVVSEKVKEALAEVVKRKHELQQVAAKKQQAEQRIREIGEDQNRIRQNMAQLDRNSDVYKNYVKKFSDQEGEIEKLRGQITEWQSQEQSLQQGAR